MATAVTELEPKGSRAHASNLRRLAATPLGAIALTADLGLLFLVVAGPMIWKHGANVYDTAALNQGPSAAHILGTDSLGRDILLRILVAARLSIGLAFAATLIGVVLGLALGLIPTVAGPRVGRAAMSILGMALAFPGLLLALFFTSFFGAGKLGALFALGIATAPFFGRLTATLATGVVNRDYISAARILGVGRFRIIGRHILPNVADTLIVNITLGLSGSLLAFAALSFLGLGIQPPSYDWGRMLNDGLTGIYVNPAAALAPGVAIVLTGLAFNLTGEAMVQLVSRRVPLGPRLGGVPLARSATAAPHAGDDGGAVLAAHDVHVTFPTPEGDTIAPVRGVTIRIRRGEAVGLVGESGSGKSLTALALAGLVEEPGSVHATTWEFCGVDLLPRHDARVHHLLATKMGIVFQDPLSSLNPVIRVGPQLAEVARHHERASRRDAMTRAVGRLRAVRVSAPERRIRQLPHELSGGMRQRAMIAMSLMDTPTLLIADEPTTSLDVTVQKKVLQLIARIRSAHGTALLLISHDVASTASVCDRILVMYAGRIVEEIASAELLLSPRHPYTRALLEAVPDLDTPRDEPLSSIPGRPPDPASFPDGCAFAPRCPFASARCLREDPGLQSTPAGGLVACWHPQSGPAKTAELATMGRTIQEPRRR